MIHRVRQYPHTVHEHQPSIAVVMPAYRVASLITEVIARVPPEVGHINRDFNVVVLFLVAGFPALGFGVLWSVYHWIQSFRLQILASTGTVMIGVLAIVLGFQLILQAIVLDVEHEPGRNRS